VRASSRPVVAWTSEPTPFALLSAAHVAWWGIVLGTDFPRRHPDLALAGMLALGFVTLGVVSRHRP
jgi:hypothetical protein